MRSTAVQHLEDRPDRKNSNCPTDIRRIVGQSLDKRWRTDGCPAFLKHFVQRSFSFQCGQLCKHNIYYRILFHTIQPNGLNNRAKSDSSYRLVFCLQMSNIKRNLNVSDSEHYSKDSSLHETKFTFSFYQIRHMKLCFASTYNIYMTQSKRMFKHLKSICHNRAGCGAPSTLQQL